MGKLTATPHFGLLDPASLKEVANSDGFHDACLIWNLGCGFEAPRRFYPEDCERER